MKLTIFFILLVAVIAVSAAGNFPFSIFSRMKVDNEFW
jgi:hypothetical protein